MLSSRCRNEGNRGGDVSGLFAKVPLRFGFAQPTEHFYSGRSNDLETPWTLEQCNFEVQDLPGCGSRITSSISSSICVSN
jgi:hypothetical protein